jgi:hypothetical protein
MLTGSYFSFRFTYFSFRLHISAFALHISVFSLHILTSGLHISVFHFVFRLAAAREKRGDGGGVGHLHGRRWLHVGRLVYCNPNGPTGPFTCFST